MGTICSQCGCELLPEDFMCPQCGSKDRTINVSESLGIDDIKLDLTKLDKNLYSGKRRFFEEIHIKPDFDRDSQQGTVVYRKIDRTDADWYDEVIQSKGGVVIKEKHEKLSKHHDRGSAKNRKKGDVG